LANAADIIVNLIAKTARFERGINRANRKLGVMAKASRTAQFAIRGLGTALVGLGASRFAQVARTQLNIAGNLQRVSETVGFTTDAIQELRFAGEQLNLQQRQLDLGLQRFSRRIAEAEQGTGELLKVANKYNIVLKDSDGNLRSSIDLLRDYADIVANTESEQEQLRLAFKAFDTEGAALVRLLRQGRDGLDAFGSEARKLGIVVDSTLVEKAAEADRQMNELSNVLRAQLLVAVAENSDGMVEFAQAINRVQIALIGATAGATNFIAGLGEDFAELIHGNADGMDLLLEQIRETERVANNVRSPLALFTGGNTDEEVDAAAKRLDFLNAAFDQFLTDSANNFNARVAEAKRRAAELASATPGSPGQVAPPFDTSGVEEVDITDVVVRVNRVMKDRARLQELINASRLREEVILDNIRFITQAIHNGEGDVNELLEVRRRLFVDLQSALDKNLDQMTELEEFGVQAARNMQTAMADFIASGADGFDDLLRNFRTMLIRMVAELVARKILLSFLGGLAGGSGPFSGFAKAVLGDITKRQAGGPLSSGQAALVGERGPELFVPNTAGKVIPRAGGFGGSIVIHQTNSFNSEGELRPGEVIPLLEENNRKLKAELLDEIDRSAFD